MKPEIFRKLNVIFITDNCSRCRILCEFIERINIKLPINERFKIVNCTYYQKFGIITDPLIQMYSKHFDGFPTIFFKNGIKISGASTRIEMEIILKTLFHELFVVHEDNPYIFNKECEFTKNRLFGGVVCKN